MIFDNGTHERDEEQGQGPANADGDRVVADDVAQNLVDQDGLQGAEHELCGLEGGGEKHAGAVIAEDGGEEAGAWLLFWGT